MKIKSLFQNITIKQADVFTILVIFLFTMVFVGLLVEEMYKEYERALEQSYIAKNITLSDSDILEQNQKKIKIPPNQNCFSNCYALFYYLCNIFGIKHSL